MLLISSGESSELNKEPILLTWERKQVITPKPLLFQAIFGPVIPQDVFARTTTKKVMGFLIHLFETFS